VKTGLVAAAMILVWVSVACAQATRPSPRAVSLDPEQRLPLYTTFDDGVLVSSADDSFQLRLHVLAQTDFKLFLPTFQEPARSGAYIPRFRVYFEGQATKSWEYELSLQRSVEGAFDVLDANVNYCPAEAFQIKVGRMLVPYSYDWYDHLEQYFITPERGLFPLNFGLSREAGAMAWGRVNEGQFQYAVGGFSGQVSGLADTNTTRDAVAYVNARPFLHQEAASGLRFLNVGGSVALGRNAYASTPLPLRTSIQSSENDEAANSASTVFLDFNEGVVARGGRFSAALHLAWYVKQLSLEAEYQVGRFGFTRPGLDRPFKVPVQGFNVTAGYFVTGEEVAGRGTVEPLRPFDPVGGHHGPGAIELFARYSWLQLSERVFAAGLADPALWSRTAGTIDAGVNWYPTRYVKFYLDWQHAMFGTPVVLNQEQDRARRQVDLLWLRCQVYY
jgi:phosphate-selective porin OprO and OprP